MQKIEISKDGIGGLLSNVNKRKSPGLEAIPEYIINFLAIELAPFLKIIYEKFLEYDSVPVSWKIAYATSVPKKGNSSRIENY